MVKIAQIIDRGDMIWIDFSPTKGHEQSGLRPAVVISTLKYNSFSGLVLVCPMTSKSKNYFFEVTIEGPKGKSYILSDQLRTFDIKERVIKKIGKITEIEMKEILAKISVLFE